MSMDSKALAEKVAVIQAEARERIVGVGRESYGGDGDAFQSSEYETVGDHVKELEEELLDTINWAALTIIKLRKARGL